MGGGRRKTPPDPHAEADRQALDTAVESMIERVLTGWDHTRPLGSLNRDDLRRLATAAITGWVLWRAESDDPKVKQELSDDVMASAPPAEPDWQTPLDG